MKLTSPLIICSSSGCDVSDNRAEAMDSNSDNKSQSTIVDGEEGGGEGGNDAAEIAHLAEQLDRISNEEETTEGSGETLNSITGGLQVSITTPVICILKANLLTISSVV